MKHLLWLALLLGSSPQDDADLHLRSATIYDGSGKEGFTGDLAIRGDEIVAVGSWKGKAEKTIDAAGLVAAPGFIDLHTHSDGAIVAPASRANRNFTHQGCTTIVTGNCGGGSVDVRKMFETLDKEGAGTNVIHLLPHGSIRQQVFGSANRPPTAEELSKMKALAEKGMKDGAWGMSTGLVYIPGTYAETDEVVEMAKVVHRHGGIYASHIRSEAKSLQKSIREAIEIGERSGCPVHISHIKCSTREAWGQMEETLGLIEAARKRGLKVTADQYPYIASSTKLWSYTIPAWAMEGGDKKLVERLDDPVQGKKIREAILENFEKRDGPGTSRIASYSKKNEWNGKTLARIAEEEGKDPVEIVIEVARNGGAQAIGFSMREEDMLQAMAKDYVATASDGSARAPGGADVPHPRNYGTFPRKIGRYAVEKKAVPLTFAIRSASGLPADILGLKDRGYLKPGFKADVVLFDPATFRDAATFDKPHQYATGVAWLWVNGQAVIADGEKTDALPGRALRLNR